VDGGAVTDPGGGCLLRARGLSKLHGVRQEMVRASDGGDLLPMPGRPMPGRPMPGQPMPGQPMPGQPMPGQPMPGRPMPGLAMSGAGAGSEWQATVRAVDEVDLDVRAGEMVAVMGPSGCGKSSLLQLLGGLDRPTAGQVWLAGERIDSLSESALARVRRTSVGFVFQSFHLLEELSVLRNVQVPALLAGSGPREARRRAFWLLERVGLADRARHRVSELSGGQRQRVAIARALSNSPLIVLADEPTGNLDSAATREVLRVFAGLAAAGQTVVVVTHDERVGAAADRVILMRDGMFTGETWLGRWSGRPVTGRPVTGWEG
jgi:putative ABC transport system ATP-binding protein